MRRVAAACAFVALGCSGDVTGVLIRLDAAPGLRAAAATIAVEVRGPEGDVAFSDSAPVDQWPVQLSLAPAGGDASREWRLRSELRDADGAVLASLRARAAYVAGEVRVANLAFDEGCRGVPDCGEEQSCVAGSCTGACVELLPRGATARSAHRPCATPLADGGLIEDAGVDDGGVDDGGVDDGGDGGACDRLPRDSPIEWEQLSSLVDPDGPSGLQFREPDPGTCTMGFVEGAIGSQGIPSDSEGEVVFLASDATNHYFVGLNEGSVASMRETGIEYRVKFERDERGDNRLFANDTLIYEDWNPGDVLSLRVSRDSGVGVVSVWLAPGDGCPSRIHTYPTTVSPGLALHPELRTFGCSPPLGEPEQGWLRVE